MESSCLSDSFESVVFTNLTHLRKLFVLCDKIVDFVTFYIDRNIYSN